jgi:hypothetical protein
MKTIMRRTSLALAMAYSATAIAQNPPVREATGAIAGIVRDRDTKQPVAGVQVYVLGGAYGTTTKDNGTYTILGVPAGAYTVIARIVGYSPVETENVVVRADVRRELNVELSAATDERARLTQPLRVRGSLPSAMTSGAPAAVVCATGPGARLGINGMQAASLSWRRLGTETIYSFQSEPVVIEVESWSALRPGDVIQSVNGEPITTRAGADHFGNPPSNADVVIAVRRNGERVEVIAPTCSAQEGPGLYGQVSPAGGGYAGTGAVRGGPGGGQAGGRVGGRSGGISGGISGGGSRASTSGGGVAAGPATPTRPVPTPAELATDSLSEAVALRDFGIVLACGSLCYRARNKAGSLYWRFIESPVVRTLPLPRPNEMTEADWPAVDAIRRGRSAGLHEGVVIERVNGHATTSEQGSLRLSHPAEYYPLNLDIRYSGRTQRVTLRAPEPAR